MTIDDIYSNPEENWKKWDARAYLNEYFRTLGPDAQLTTEFVARELASFKNKPVSKLLEFGAGPTLIGIFGATMYAKEIHIADYLASNLHEIKLWLKNDPKAFDWSETIAYILQLEKSNPTKEAILIRADETRRQVTRVMKCDASQEWPLPIRETYPLVISLYCADSATASQDVWKIYMRNILKLVAPSGVILVAALRQCKLYKVGDFSFPSANISERDLRRVFLANGFSKNKVDVEVVELPERKSEGFTGLLFARAQKM